MIRRRFRKPAVQVSLFPFLAVLVCTMGSLIVLLVLVVQQARVYANSQPAKSEVALPTLDKSEDMELAVEDQTWRREILEQQRQQLQQQLADQRLKLGHTEDHIRRLEEKWKQLEAQAEEIQQLDNVAAGQQRETQTELEELAKKLEAARKELEAAQEDAAAQPRSFAIIPYDGPNGTQRRPIYIECREDRIVLQPEGVVLQPTDLEGPLGPGNPLDAALRATREHLARVYHSDHEPYPLLIVRPKGTISYALARQAMRSWDDEFGYELVDDNTQLQYQPADNSLRELQQKAIRDARQRQTILAAAMPSRYGRGGSQVGNSPLRVSPGGGTGSSPLGTSGTGSSFGSSRNSSSLSSSGSSPNTGQQGSGSRRTGNQAIGGGPMQEQAGQAGGPQGQTGPEGHGGPQTRGAAGNPNGVSLSSSLGRGKNWGLPQSSANATGITRPIGVICLPDRLIILPEQGDHRQPRVVLTPQGVEPVVDELVSNLWKQMELWGLAIAGGYWKPVLQVQVGSGAELRFQELHRALQGSGIDVERKVR